LIRGKLRRRNLNKYVIRVRSTSLERFQDKVGFCIRRKSERLAFAVLIGPDKMRGPKWNPNVSRGHAKRAWNIKRADF